MVYFNILNIKLNRKENYFSFAKRAITCLAFRSCSKCKRL